MNKTILILTLLISLSIDALSSYTPKIQVIAEDQGIIWAFDFLPGGNILFTEREGTLKHLDMKTKKIREVPGTPKVEAVGQGGLLDIHIDEDLQVFLTYSRKDPKAGITTAVYSARWEDMRLVEGRTIFIADTYRNNEGRHFGSRIEEDNRGDLFITIGDRGERDYAQKLTTHQGKVLRISKEGKALEDNPFVGRKDVLPEIYSYGHRNAQGSFYDRGRNELWINEHGPRGGDEINLVEAGRNYGWPVITYGREYHGPRIGEGTEKEGMEQPFYHYTPSIAPSGLFIYSGKMFKDWKGSFFSGALKLKHLNRLYEEDGRWIEERIDTFGRERVRSIGEAPDGSIFIGTDSGRIIRLYI